MDQMRRVFKIFQFLLCILNSVLVITPAYATQLVPIADTHGYVFMFSAGPGWVGNSATQSVYYEQDLAYGFDGKNTTRALMNAEMFIGARHFLMTGLQGELGLAFAGGSSAPFNGDVLVDADPNFNNFNYQYYVQHGHIAVKEKVLITVPSLKDVMPYVDASIGVGFNHSYNFEISPKIYEQLPPSAFGSNTTTTFTYTVGTGLQKILTKHWQMGVGYAFADWGKSQLARSPDQEINNGLTLANVYIHSLLVNVTYVN